MKKQINADLCWCLTAKGFVCKNRARIHGLCLRHYISKVYRDAKK